MLRSPSFFAGIDICRHPKCAEHIDGSKNPHGLEGSGCFGEAGGIGVDADETFDTPYAGHKIAQGKPQRTHCIARPRKAGEKKEYHRCEYDDYESALALFHEII